MRNVVRGPRSVVRLACVAVSLLVSWPAAGQEKATLRVLFTSDMHAHVLPFDDVRERPARGSIAQVATVVARERLANPANVVLDGGDEIEGTPLEYYAIAAPGASGADPAIAAMNLVGYDAAVIGNHEFNFGLDVLRRSLSQARFPWLAANLGGAENAGLRVGDELVLERGGIRVGVLGLTNPNIPHWDPPEHWRGLTFADPVAVAAARIPELRKRADVVIVVVHSGFERDLATGASDGTENENFAWRLAQLPGIDLLLTGHTHRNIPPQRLGATVVAQPGRWGDFVTEVDLDLAREGGTWKVAGWRGENIPTGSEPPDPRVVAAVAAEETKVKAELARPLGELTAPLEVRALPVADDPGVDLIHAVQLEATGAELSLAAPLGGGHTEFPAGPLTPRLAHALYPYPNTLLVVRLTGAELKDVLEHAVRGWTGVGCGGAGCTLERDRRLPTYNYDTLAGATYLVDPAAPVGSRILGLRVAGKPVLPGEEFTVAINSYRAAGGGGYPHLASAPRVKEIDRPMVSLIVDYFTRHRRVTPAADDNWAFTVPLRDAPARAPASAP
ncbi:MAG: bifunctional UDP-sugar hydrolase/5'-nucleotidase [Thermoanaerobaculaceae bacterium]|nr:bifunctional UDP-sugar hydrolase/5'-nucleotidase [Thermoanaerobaculaceae bacterium]